MKTLLTVGFGACLLMLVSCVKPKEPNAKICPEEPVVITTKDTLVLENCSEHYDTQRWELPDGSFSTQNKVAFTNTVPGVYNIILKVSNNDYANDYVAERKIEVRNP